jgi:hypothetical protein
MKFKEGQVVTLKAFESESRERAVMCERLKVNLENER